MSQDSNAFTVLKHERFYYLLLSVFSNKNQNVSSVYYIFF